MFVQMSDGAFLYTEFWESQETRKKGTTAGAVPVRGEAKIENQPDCIVLIPGFCCTTAFFEKNSQALSSKYDVITYDPRGQGNSSKGLQGHTVARNAQDIKELLERFGKKRAVVVAWSMAGQFIMDYVRLFGCLYLAGIVLADCPLHALGSEPWNAHGLRGENMDHFNAHLVQSYNGWEKYCEGFAEKIWGGIDDEKIAWAAAEFKKTPPWIAFAIYSDMVYRCGYPYLRQAKVPMLFTGADSRVTENGKDLAQRWYTEGRGKDLRSESCTFENGGHVFFMVEAERFNARVLDFAVSCTG